MADNEQSANYETAPLNLDETLNQGTTYNPGVPVIRTGTVPDPTEPEPAAPAANPEPKPETSGA
ncbi:hypothetical protein [Amycolatopsis sp. NBC_01480]|jgi:hypothetical protein|uniref:hypothetical protein n=1 Tax=Amycolatopsis sp. NBC_01480 TaxID=2903562 RepID=UPI002E2E5514|nr:hypothetical protein [Amycolatopsis sp. NBC_01480]